MKRNRHPTIEDNEVLVPRAQAGDAYALAQLVKRNTPLCYQAAIRMEHLCTSLSREDLVSEGQHGILVAARKFDASMGNQFTTYMVWWIRSFVGRAVANDCTAFAAGNKFKRTVISRKYARMRIDLQARGLSVEAVRAELAQAFNLSLKHVTLLETFQAQSLSLDKELDPNDDGKTLHTLLPSQVPRADESYEREELAVEVRKRLAEAELSPREIAIVDGRLLAAEGDMRTLGDIGVQFGVTRERIRQIETRLHKKLRSLFVTLRAPGVVAAQIAEEESPWAGNGRGRRNPPIKIGDKFGRYDVVELLERTSRGHEQVKIFCRLCKVTRRIRVYKLCGTLGCRLCTKIAAGLKREKARQAREALSGRVKQRKDRPWQ